MTVQDEARAAAEAGWDSYIAANPTRNTGITWWASERGAFIAGFLAGVSREPTDAEIEAAAVALHDRQWRTSTIHPRWGQLGHCLTESDHRAECVADARAALAAARKAVTE